MGFFTDLFISLNVANDELKRQKKDHDIEGTYTDEELDAYGLTDEEKRLVREEGWDPWDFNDDEDEEPEDDDYYGEDDFFNSNDEDDDEDEDDEWV